LIDLEELFAWADKNNMKFNNDKFVLLQYGRSRDPQEQSYVLPGNVKLTPSASTRDLGIEMSCSGDFDEHIAKTTLACRRLSGMLFRSFQTRQADHLLPVYKALIQSRLDYCSVLWTPKRVTPLRLIEKVQSSFTRRLIIEGQRGSDLDYWQRLKRLKLFSVQRRHERYAAIYVWKIRHGIVHNPGLEFENSARRGTWCKVPRHSSRQREESFLVWGPKVFNSLPKDIRDFTVDIDCVRPIEKFKKKLDLFLKDIPDKPNMGQDYTRRMDVVDIYSGRRSNSLCDILNYTRATV